MPRRLLRTIAIIAALLVIALLAGRLLVQRTAQTRFDQTRADLAERLGPLELSRLIPPAVDADSNAATWLVAGADAIVFDGDDGDDLQRLAAMPSAAWTDGDPDDAARIIDRQAPALALLERARPLDQSNFNLDYLGGFEMEIPDLLAQLQAARLLTVDARLAFQRGDAARALDALDTLGTQIASIENEPPAIFQLVASAIRRHQLHAVHECLTDSAIAAALGDADLQRLDAMLARLEGADPYRESLRGEIIVTTTYLEDHDLRPRPDDLDVLGTDPVPWPASLLEPLHNARAIETYLPIVDTIDEPYPVQRDAAATLAADGPIASFIPNFTSMALKIRATAAAHHLARLAIGLRRAALATGAYPADLSADPTAGEPVQFSAETARYMLHPDGSASLDLPRAAELWAEDDPLENHAGRIEPPLTWKLPAPPAAAP